MDTFSASLRQRRPAPQPSDDRALNFESLQQIQQQVAPIFVHLAALQQTLDPFLRQISHYVQLVWTALQPYHPEDLFLALYGFFLVFFGGVFMTLVSSVEAALQFGWDRIRTALLALHVEWRKALEAFERDNKIDQDRDGTADVDELSATDLAARRLMVLTRSIDPENVSAALEGLTIAAVAILATLRVRFAKAITLGTSIGNILYKLLSPFTTSILQFALPDEYEKWIPVLNKYGFRYIGISLSWILMRMITSVFAALRGSELFVMGVIAYLERHGHVRPDLFESGDAIVIAAWALLAVFGVYWQVSSMFALPFPLNLVLLPLTIAEKMVMFAVGASAE